MTDIIPENTDGIQRINGKFAPGVSGNPAGKPKGSKHITTLFLEALKSRKNENGKSYEELFIDRILTETIIKGKGDMLKQAWDHVDGRPNQAIDLTSDGERIGGGTMTDQEIQIMATELAERLKKKKTNIIE